MPESQFWALIARLHGSNSDHAYKGLSATLAGLPTRQIMAFDARMAIALYALDDECRHDWYAQHDPLGVGSVADDDFLYARADTVTAGHGTWRAAVRTDTLAWGAVDPTTGGGELLLHVDLDAAAARGLTDDDWINRESEAFTLSYETGSNPAGWPKPDSSN